MLYEYAVKFVFANAVLFVQVMTDVPVVDSVPEDEDRVVKAAREQFKREVGLTIPLGKAVLEIEIELTDIVEE